MQLCEVLDNFRKKEPHILNENIKNNILQIVKICNAKYYNGNRHGHSGLNRKILLDKQIADFLTPDVILYIFSSKKLTSDTFLNRTVESLHLSEAIYDGFKEGLSVIKLMTNNDVYFTEKEYENQKKNFEENTLRIVESIKKAALVEQIEVDVINSSCLLERFEKIISIINKIKDNGESDDLLSVPGYLPRTIRAHVNDAFRFLCQKVGVEYSDNQINITLDRFCELFLNNPTAILHPEITQMFYDKEHLEAALEQDTKINFCKQSYAYQDIFRCMVKKLAQAAETYPTCAKEQFYLRIGLVEKDLENRFPEFQPNKSSIEDRVVMHDQEKQNVVENNFERSNIVGDIFGAAAQEEKLTDLNKNKILISEEAYKQIVTIVKNYVKSRINSKDNLNWTSRHFRDAALTMAKVNNANSFLKDIENNQNLPDIMEKVNHYLVSDQALEKNKKTHFFFTSSRFAKCLSKVQRVLHEEHGNLKTINSC